MKKIAVLAALLAVSFVANAQKVETNEINEKGVWNIETEFRAFFTEDKMHGYTLSYSEDKDTKEYLLTFFFMEQHSRWEAKKAEESLLIKTAKNEKVYLQCLATKSKLAKDRKGINYMTSAIYRVPEENISLIEDGLVKIRINQVLENGSESYFDIELPDDVTVALKKAVKNIKKAIAQGATIDKSEF